MLSKSDSILNALGLRFRKKYDTSMDFGLWFYEYWTNKYNNFPETHNRKLHLVDGPYFYAKRFCMNDFTESVMVETDSPGLKLHPYPTID